MLRTIFFTLAGVAALTALGTLGHAHLIERARRSAPPVTFTHLQIVKAGAELTGVRLIHSRMRARASTLSLKWSGSLQPTVRIEGITAQAGPVEVAFSHLDAEPAPRGWRVAGVGHVNDTAIDLVGRVDAAARSLIVEGASGPLFRGRLKGTDLQVASMKLDASDRRHPAMRLRGVDARRGRAWWGGGDVAVVHADCGWQPTLKGGDAWYGAGSDTAAPAAASTQTAGTGVAALTACPIQVEQLAVAVASPFGVRHVQLHAADLRPGSIQVRASGPEGAGSLIAATDRHWALARGSVDLAQLPEVMGISATGAAHGQVAMVSLGDSLHAHVDGRVDGQIEHAAIAADPVDLSGAAIVADVHHAAGALKINVHDLHRAGVHASAQITATSKIVELRAALALTDCQSLWAAIPDALRGPYADAQLSGQIAPRVHFRLPRANAKKLTLQWDGPSDCTVDALKTRAEHQPAAQVSGARDDVDWLLRDFRLPVQYATRAVEVGPGTAGYVPISQLPRWVGAAAIVSEDNSFNRGKALNLGLLRRALMFNLDRGRYVYGGSTIPQQLAKNLFLTRSKTLARKLQEAIVALRMVQVVPTRRILELYLNCIEFAPNVYGIERAARHYFQKGARQLTPKEAAFLGISKPSPRYAAAMRRRGSTPETPHFREYMRRIIERMRKRGAISSAQAAAARPFRIRWRGGRRIFEAENRPQATQL